MRFFPLEIPGAFRIEVERREDERGFLARTFCVNEFGGQGLVTAFRQHSASFNRHKGTLRGLHYQVDPHAEVKLVRCTAGAVFDVLVDLRRSSPTFGRWHGEVLSADNHVMLYIPAGCAHGFQALERATVWPMTIPRSASSGRCRMRSCHRRTARAHASPMRKPSPDGTLPQRVGLG